MRKNEITQDDILSTVKELEFISRFVIYDTSDKKKTRKKLKKLIKHLENGDVQYCFEEETE